MVKIVSPSLALGLLDQRAAKPIYRHQVVVKESTVFIAGPSKEKRQRMLKRPKLPDGFQRRVFKGNILGEGCSLWSLFWLVVGGGVLRILIIKLLVPTSLGSMCLWSACSHHFLPGWWSQFLQNNSKICVRWLRTSLEGELRLCFITELLLKLSLLFLLNCFSFVPALPHFPN